MKPTKMSKNKVTESETRTINRSQISFASYNARKISDESRKKLKANIKANGILGGLLWNEKSGNLVSGHQRVSVIDEINKYNTETKANDYPLKVDVVNFDDKKEKEMNIFLNSTAVQGTYNYEMLADLMKDIDADLAGLDAVDLSYIEMAMPDYEKYTVPEYNPQADKEIAAEINNGEHDDVLEEDKPVPDNSKTSTSGMTEAEKIAHVKNVKNIVKEGSKYLGEPYFTVSFDSFENKAFFLERFNLDAQTRFVKGEELSEMIGEPEEEYYEEAEIVEEE